MRNMSRRSPASSRWLRLALFALFVLALMGLRGHLAREWRAGEQRARDITQGAPMASDPQTHPDTGAARP